MQRSPAPTSTAHQDLCKALPSCQRWVHQPQVTHGDLEPHHLRRTQHTAQVSTGQHGSTQHSNHYAKRESRLRKHLTRVAARCGKDLRARAAGHAMLADTPAPAAACPCALSAPPLCCISAATPCACRHHKQDMGKAGVCWKLSTLHSQAAAEAALPFKAPLCCS